MLNTDKRPATLQNINLRIQKHGSERVPAADLKFVFQVPSDQLDTIEPGLKETLYRQPKAGDQMELQPDATGAWTVLRHPGLEPIRLKGKFPGYEAALLLPFQEDDPDAKPLGLVDVELKKITVEAHDGGTATVTVTASLPVDEEELGDFWAYLESGDVLLTLDPPRAQPTATVAPAATVVAEDAAAVH